MRVKNKLSIDLDRLILDTKRQLRALERAKSATEGKPMKGAPIKLEIALSVEEEKWAKERVVDA